MPTILEISRHSGVPADKVIRVVNGEPVSADTVRRVRVAIAELGEPQYPPREAAVPEVLPVTPPPADELLERLVDATAELEARIPGQVGSVVYEALRVEVRPVAEHVASMESLFGNVLTGLRELAAQLAAERRNRVDDLALQVELIRTGWTNVDRRLGRIERMLERQAASAPASDQGPKLVQFDARERPGPAA
jgi:hypothetical protein